jgi:release factor glutamine methyltransferase
VSPDEDWTVKRLLDATAQHLQSKRSESARAARSEAQLLLAHVLGWTPTRLYTDFDFIPDNAKRADFRELVRQRSAGKPVAHLLGRKGFFLLDFDVTPDVLIPRPDTETLVTEALQLAKPLPGPRILDVGTGSGCIAISLAHQHRTATVTAIDISEKALGVARRNAEKHSLLDRITFRQGDLFEAVPGEMFDLIVSNPPYIPTAHIAGLDADVRDYEPHLALDGGVDGFVVVDRLLAGAMAHLAMGGHLLFEIGYDQEVEARARVERHGYELAPTTHDTGGQPRVLRARRVG